MSINLFIPAAGLGTRLRPLTLLAPKPLLPIAGIPLIQRIIEKINSDVEVKKIGINTHYLPETVENWKNSFVTGSYIQLFQEEKILGTGGALKNAKSLLSQERFILANGDVLSDIDWKALVDHHVASNNLVTLAVQDRTHERRVGVDADNKLVLIDKECATPGIDHWFGYACAAVYEPEFLDYLPEGESHVVPYWVDCAKETGRVGVFDIGKETYWLDLGTPDSFVEASVDMLMGEKRFLKTPLSIPWDCQLAADVIIEEDVAIGDNVSLENVILLPGSSIASGGRLKNAIVGPGFQHKVEWPAERICRGDKNKIGQGASDRVYKRVSNKVILNYSAFEQNIGRQEELTAAFLKSGVNVPAIIEHNVHQRTVELQDLGDLTLRQWMLYNDDIEPLLSQALDQLLKLQFTDDVLCPSIHDKVFNYDVLRWETSYFKERFVMRLCQYSEDLSELEREFHRLAEEVNSFPKRVMHRDFQSENVMIHEGKPWLIDFQGAHWGPSVFDLVSFLKDPYVNYPDDLMEKMKTYYFSEFSNRTNESRESLERAYILCGLQRHMQALGAYGFISTIRGKKSFEKHCRPAFDLLFAEVLLVQDEFPALYRLLCELEGRF